MTTAPSSRRIALAGALALAAAMGIGRFAFTPLLPLMVRDGQLDLAAGGWLAAANYAGYLTGALSAARLPWSAPGLARVALAATAVLTAAMAWREPAAWLVLRFLAGMASAWVFVATSAWCLAALAHLGRGALAGWVYAGVGGGIALVGLYCLAAASAGVPAAHLWLHLGGLATLLALPVASVLRRLQSQPAPPAQPADPSAGADAGLRGLTVCYGVMGFGYILPATFLPALARTVVDDPRLFGLAWPLFGLTAAVSTVVAGRLLRQGSRLRVWAASQAAMGTGVLLPALALNGFTVAASAVLVGATFMVITLAGVQEVRARVPAQAAQRVGRITAAFAVGQIAGPALSALLLQWPVLGARALPWALLAGACALFATSLWLWRQASFPPHPQELPHAR